MSALPPVLVCQAGDQCKRPVVAYDANNHIALCAQHAAERGVSAPSPSPPRRQPPRPGSRAASRRMSMRERLARFEAEAAANRARASSLPASPSPQPAPAPVAAAPPPETSMSPPSTCPVHPGRRVTRYAVCDACLSNLTATVNRYLAKGSLPGAGTLAAQALKHVDLDAAERARWSWTEGARALHAALQHRDTQVAIVATSQDATEQVATMATCEGEAHPAPAEGVPAPAPPPAPADEAPTDEAPATASTPEPSTVPSPELADEDVALLEELSARGFVEERPVALSPLARAEEIAARQAELQAELVRLSVLKAELFALEAEKIVAESEAILAAGLPEDPGALLPALPADARAALLSCIDRELWGRRVRTLHSIARVALDDRDDAQHAAAPPSIDRGAIAAAK